MIIYPAIDLLGGQAVRLYQGDYNQVTVYDSDPVALAQRFAAQGAQWLHLVDLDGARSGQTSNFALIRRIAQEGGLNVQVGGGIRSVQAARGYLDCGVDRVILGTAAVEDRVLLEDLINIYAGLAAVAVDVRDGYVAIKGWTASSTLQTDQFLKKMEALGVETLIVTDISRDGAMRGPNMALYDDIRQRYSFQLIASGGVTSLADIRALRQLHIHGAIVGKALYTGDIRLEEAIEVAR